MYLIIIINMILLIISLMIMLLASMLSKKNMFNREKTTPFECGFEPFNSSRLPFSIKFFLIAIIFLIFDVEIALMMPMIMSMNANNIFNWFWTTILFIVMLIIGLYHEWNQGALEWTK